MNLNERIAALEHDARANRRRLAMGLPATFLAGIGVALLMGSSMTASERVRTKRIDIVGDDGRTMLALSTDAHGGRLDVWTPQGRNIMRLAGNEHGGDLAVWSNDGITNAGLWAAADGGAMALWEGSGARLAHLSSSGMQVAGDVAVGDGITLVADSGHIVSSLGESTASLRHDGLRIGESVALDNAGLLLKDTTSRMHLAPTGLHAPTGTLAFGQAGPQLTAGDGALQVHATGMTLYQGDLAVLGADSLDGTASLVLAAAGSDLAMTVDAQGARTQLRGPEDVVTLAAHAQEPLLAADGGGLTLMASGSSGAIELGQGEAGRIRMVAGTDGSVPAVEVLDAAGLRAAALSMEASGAGALVAGHGGTPTAIMRGRSAGGRLDLRGELGTVLVRSGSGPMAALLGPDGRTQAMLAGTGTGGVLNLMDLQGMPVVLTGASAEGRGGAAAFRNAQGEVVVTAGAGPQADGRVRVVDPSDNQSSTLTPPRSPVVHAGAMSDDNR